MSSDLEQTVLPLEDNTTLDFVFLDGNLYWVGWDVGTQSEDALVGLIKRLHPGPGSWTSVLDSAVNLMRAKRRYTAGGHVIGYEWHSVVEL